MSQPLEPELSPQEDGIPAADPGAGAPRPAAGFGVEGEQPDRPPADAGGDHADPPDDPPATPRDDTPFRTPEPTQLGPGAGA